MKRLSQTFVLMLVMGWFSLPQAVLAHSHHQLRIATNPLSCSGTLKPNLDQWIADLIAADHPDLLIKMGDRGLGDNPNITLQGWGQPDHYYPPAGNREGDLAIRQQTPGQDNRVDFELNRKFQHKLVIGVFDLGKGLANDAGQITFNGHRPACANDNGMDYGNPNQVGSPARLQFAWSAYQNGQDQANLVFHNQPTGLVDPNGVAGTGWLRLWFVG